MENQILEFPMPAKAWGNLTKRPLWKRLLDLSVIIVLLPAILPVMLLVVVVIKAVSRGPVLFRQDRIGFLGKPFVCFKFRTMRVDASTAVHQGYFKQLMNSEEPMTKMDTMGDPRLIPLGSILRATGLDELPQLLNVMRGEMSIVGPRPCTPFEYSNYRPWQKQRFNTIPGLTGLWQVSGKNKTTFNEMIRLDILYAEKKCLRLDLKIILKTFPVVFLQLKEILTRVKERSKAA
jgi:lipopolysaccharide/colanic/teichoic acid biosynthesis glycosyltransferase